MSQGGADERQKPRGNKRPTKEKPCRSCACSAVRCSSAKHDAAAAAGGCQHAGGGLVGDEVAAAGWVGMLCCGVLTCGAPGHQGRPPGGHSSPLPGAHQSPASQQPLLLPQLLTAPPRCVSPDVLALGARVVVVEAHAALAANCRALAVGCGWSSRWHSLGSGHGCQLHGVAGGLRWAAKWAARTQAVRCGHCMAFLTMKRRCSHWAAPHSTPPHSPRLRGVAWERVAQCRRPGSSWSRRRGAPARGRRAGR